MKKVSFLVDPALHGAQLFDEKKALMSVTNKDKYLALRRAFRGRGYVIDTDDIIHPDESDLLLYLDLPKTLPKEHDAKKSYLLALESSLVCPGNNDKYKHHGFRRVFTWNDDLVDHKTYIKINYSFDLPKSIPRAFAEKKLCCLIVSNKFSKHSNELYGERRKLIRWFEESYPLDFDLYGYGWDRYKFRGPVFFRAFNAIPCFGKLALFLIGKRYLSYRGIVENKILMMSQYKFTFAYENVRGDRGYITEKLFDAFCAGCVPIYLGADNITEHIPKDCFIDRREFDSIDSVYERISTMPSIEYIGYQNRIEAFLNSRQAEKFSANRFAETVVNACLS